MQRRVRLAGSELHTSEEEEELTELKTGTRANHALTLYGPGAESSRK